MVSIKVNNFTKCSQTYVYVGSQIRLNLSVRVGPGPVLNSIWTYLKMVEVGSVSEIPLSVIPAIPGPLIDRERWGCGVVSISSGLLASAADPAWQNKKYNQ